MCVNHLHDLFLYLAAQTLMASNALNKEKDRHKRETERNTGKDLLIAYLSDVGGYDREYRDVSDQDEDGSAGENCYSHIIPRPLLLYKGWSI